MKRILVLLAGMIAAAIFVVPAFAQGAGFVEICKASGSPAVTGTFSFLINDEIEATANAGECTAPIEVPDGTATIEETNYTDANGFSTDDFTAVSAIHTSQPGGPDDALESFSLSGRSAVVDVAGGDESTTTIVTFTNVLVQGYVEICKAQVTGAGLDSQSFSYAVQGAMGFTASANVLVGSCSNPIYAPAGHVNIAEGGPSAFVTSISTQPSDRLLDSDLAAGTATVAVVPAALGAVSNESIVTYTNNSAQLKICKVAGDAALVGQSYSFTANGAPFSVTAGAGAGHCVLAGRYRAGTSITVVEAPSAGQAVGGISILPSGRTFVRGGSDFLGQSATLTLGPGETVLTYTNVLASPGLLKICKAGAGSGLATFTVAGPRGTAPNITQGTDTVMVPVGGCALAPSSYPYAGIQTITETPMAGFSVSSITVADADRLVAGSVNLAAGSVGAYIGSGVTVATFTNAVATGTPPPAGGGGAAAGGTTSGGATTSSAAGSAAAASSSAAGSAAAASSSASTTAVSAPKAVKAAKKASVAKVQIVSMKSGRYVVVRVSGAAKTARIKVTLIGARSKVLKVALRTVRTNRAVKVGNLKLGPKVRSVKVAIA
jgi:trimeric autotransporter adhesin